MVLRITAPGMPEMANPRHMGKSTSLSLFLTFIIKGSNFKFFRFFFEQQFPGPGGDLDATNGVHVDVRPEAHSGGYREDKKRPQNSNHNATKKPMEVDCSILISFPCHVGCGQEMVLPALTNTHRVRQVKRIMHTE